MPAGDLKESPVTNEFVHPLVEFPDVSATTDLVHIQATQAGAVTVTMNRPAKKNAFNDDLISGLEETFETLKGAEGVRVVFIRGAGGVFSAGADLEWMRAAIDRTESDNRADAFALAKMLKGLRDLPVLTVALIEGGAFGGGAGLAAACDLAISTRDAKFSFSEARLGLIPAAISPYVIEAIGPRVARGLFATARVFDAAHAERIGLVSELVDDAAGLGAAAHRIATEILACGPEAVAASKELVEDVAGRVIDHALMELTAQRIAAARVSPEGQEGVRAFLERRKPHWAPGE
jgi:methylglutaconyl-CoA hydratase